MLAGENYSRLHSQLRLRDSPAPLLQRLWPRSPGRQTSSGGFAVVRNRGSRRATTARLWRWHADPRFRSRRRCSPAHLLAVVNPRIAGKAYNIGSGQQTTLLGLLGMMGRHVDATVKPMFTRARPGDPVQSRGYLGDTARDLGYCPRTNLAEDLPPLSMVPRAFFVAPGRLDCASGSSRGRQSPT